MFLRADLIASFLLISLMNAEAKEPRQGLESLISPLVTEREIRSWEQLNSYPIEEITAAIEKFSHYPPPELVGGFVKWEHPLSDTLSAPAYLWVPSSYNPSIPTPLILYLHGGVSRPQFPEVNPEELAKWDIVQLAEKQGWLFLFPLGRARCTWWDEVGMANILWFLREVKRKFNVDDDRVVMGGFSDGGSASFHWAMLHPTPFAFFLPWSGHPAVGSLAGPYQQYLPNLSSRSLYATFGGRDRLYPAERMLPMTALAMQAGGEIYVTVYDTAGHNGAYLQWEYPLLADRIVQRPRREIPTRLYWECDDLRWNRIEWLEITQLDTLQPPAPWHKDWNDSLTDERLTIGFQAQEKEGVEGVVVGSVMEDPQLPAVRMGLTPGDIVVAFDDSPVRNAEELERAKVGKKRGEDFILKIIRDGQELTLRGTFPPPRRFPAFRRDRASGAVKAYRIGNRFILELSRVKSVAIYIAPEMIRWDQPVEFIVDGEWVARTILQPDKELLVNTFLSDGDRRRLWWARWEWTKP